MFVKFSILSLLIESFLIVHPSKAFSPMLVTELGMVTEVRSVHLKKAYSPMLVTELGMSIEVRPEQ